MIYVLRQRPTGDILGMFDHKATAYHFLSMAEHCDIQEGNYEPETYYIEEEEDGMSM